MLVPALYLVVNPTITFGHVAPRSKVRQRLMIASPLTETSVTAFSTNVALPSTKVYGPRKVDDSFSSIEPISYLTLLTQKFVQYQEEATKENDS